MDNEFLHYYERELSFLRKLGGEFAAKHPKIAGRLGVDSEPAEPHTERLLEGLAFLASRIHLKLDNDFPEITEAFLSVVYPHYLRPIPPMTVVQMLVDPAQGKQTAGYTVPRGSGISARPVGGVVCRFRTCYRTTLWPVTVAEADWLPAERIQPPLPNAGAAAVLRLVLQCPDDLTFDKLGAPSLRFYIDGTGSFPSNLYELLFNNCTRVHLRNTGVSKLMRTLSAQAALHPVGFDDEESILPTPRRTFSGYRLLEEYFAFPEKFHFFDLRLEGATAGMGNKMEVLLPIRAFEREERRQMMEEGVKPAAFRLGCTPAANIFDQSADAIRLRRADFEYPIVPDRRRQHAMDIFSVESVRSQKPGSPEVVTYQPLFALRHQQMRADAETYWFVRRKPNIVEPTDPGMVWISLVDLSARPRLPDTDAITVNLLCTNRDLPSRLPLGNPQGDFELDSGGPVKRIISVKKPTGGVQALKRDAVLWRLISHLSLNHLSLGDTEAFQEMLRLYNFSGEEAPRRWINGIRSVKRSPHFARVHSEHGFSFAKGNLVEMELDEEQFAGSGAYLFATMLDRFLGMYVSLNSFTQLRLRTKQRKEVVRTWAPRAGRKILM